jgi:CubicO group peptidase (beta-lactamase class C family)
MKYFRIIGVLGIIGILGITSAYKPGERFEYGGLAMQVAGRMAETATGKDWETFFQERIARPLGMTNTHFTPVDQEQSKNPVAVVTCVLPPDRNSRLSLSS